MRHQGNINNKQKKYMKRWALANQFCKQNGLVCRKVTDELIAEISCFKGTCKLDFKNEIDYENTSLN